MDENDGGDGNANKDLPYKLSMDTQEVLFNGALHALRQLLMEKRKQDPEASASFWAFFNCSNTHVLGSNYFSVHGCKLFTLQASFAYHDIIDEPDRGPGAFKLEVKHAVKFKPAPSTVAEGPVEDMLPTILQTQVAARVNNNVWTNTITSIVWSVKWSQNGLMPVRPHVVLLEPVTLAIGRAVLLK